MSTQLQMQQQTLLKAVRERLRNCQLSLQEQQSFDETLQTTWAWLSNIQERLTALNSTTGNKETLEKRLGLIQVSKFINIHSSLITKNFSIEKLFNCVAGYLVNEGRRRSKAKYDCREG